MFVFFFKKKGIRNVYLSDCEQRILVKKTDKNNTNFLLTILCELRTSSKKKLHGHQTRPRLLTVRAAVLFQ